jgi:Na+(H+)/acetate symporter ActP
MKQNMGPLDRVLRISIALVIAVLYFTDHMNGTAAIILGLLAVIFVVTSFIGVCPLYIPLKLSTKKDQKTEA